MEEPTTVGELKSIGDLRAVANEVRLKRNAVQGKADALRVLHSYALEIAAHLKEIADGTANLDVGSRTLSDKALRVTDRLQALTEGWEASPWSTT